MAENRSMSRFRRGAGEFTIIFVGVVLALAADDFRETRSEAEEAGESLALVYADLVADSLEFVDVGGSTRRHTEAAAWLVERWEDTETDPDSAVLALSAFQTGRNLQLNSSAYEGLLSSNRLRLIKSDSVRAAIVLYYQFRQVAIREFNEGRLSRLETLLYEALPPYVRYLGGEQGGTMLPFQENGMTLRTSFGEVTSDPLVHSEIIWTGRFADFMCQFLLEGEQEASRLMALIRSEIEPETR
jgi:hypothetical protein